VQTAITIVGGVIGLSFGQPGLGLTLGAMLGSYLYPPESGAQKTRIGGLQFSAPQAGQVLPIIYGRTKVGGTIIWYGDFQTHAADSGGSGGGGKGTGQDTYTVGLAIAIAEGRITSLLRMWAGDSEVLPLGGITTNWGDGRPEGILNAYMNAAAVAAGQTPVAYPGITYVVLPIYPLGYTSNIPSFTFEVARTTADVIADNAIITTLGLNAYPEDANGDMNPVVCLADFMTNPRYGLGFAATDLDAERWQQEAAYAQYMELYCSPVLDAMQPGTAHIEHLLSYFDGMLVFSQGKFKLHSRRSPSRENLPYSQIQPWEWLDGYVPKYSRTTDRQAANTVTVEYLNRADNYISTPAERRDDWDIGRRGLYREQIALNGVTTAIVADRIASKLLWARITGPATVEWGMGPAGAWYEPGKLVTFDAIGAAAYALEGSWYRITKITENPDGTFIFVAVEER
jgi:hypothetical protein